MNDKVNHPSHYCKGNFEVIEVIVAIASEVDTLTEIPQKPFICYCLGNAIKYLLRCCSKGDFLTDIKKAIWYLNKIVEILENK